MNKWSASYVIDDDTTSTTALDMDTSGGRAALHAFIDAGINAGATPITVQKD
jgi:hypothetical protein